MSSTASYASGVNTSPPAVASATADTSLTAPTHTAVIFSAGTNGSRVDRVRFIQIASVAAAGQINIFRKSGGTYYLLDTLAYSVVSISSSSQPSSFDIDYTLGLVLKTGDTLEFTVTTTAGQSAFVGHAFGGDF